MKINKIRKRKPRSTFCKNLIEYLSRSQVQGYKFIVQTDRPLYERVLWSFFTIFGISLTFWLIMTSYFEFLQSPTVTSEDAMRTSVLELSFPAVTVCSANRISRTALLNYSEFILHATKDQHLNIGRSVDEVFNNLARIGQMYTMDLSGDDFNKLELIHSVLNTVYGESYPIYNIMLMLAPTCTALIKSCRWQGHFVKCSEIFTTRKTFMGPCCTFNYQRPPNSILKTQQDFNQTIPKLEKPLQINSYGFDFGLKFLVDHSLNDYVFTMNSYTGAAVLIHDSYDYADQTSGAVREKLISPQQEVYLTLHPTLIQGSRSMKSFNISSRNCVFKEEINLVFSNFYSLSECLFTCRVTNIIHVCGCSPPQYTNLFNVSACLLNDLDCLNRWRESWYNTEPTTKANDAHINDYHCTECVPKCTGIKYLIHTSESTFDPQELKQRSRKNNPNILNFTDPNVFTDHSIVSVNFGANKVRSYDQTASYQWYGLLANLGAIGCVSLGATIVSIIEIIYFFSGKLGAIWIRKHLRNIRRNRSEFEFVH